MQSTTGTIFQKKTVSAFKNKVPIIQHVLQKFRN